HGGPVVVHMGDPVSFQEIAVARAEVRRVADFYGITRAGRQLREEPVKCDKKSVGVRAESLELKDEGAGMVPEPLARGPKHEVVAQGGIEKPGVRVAGAPAVSRQIGEGWNGDVFPYLRTEVEVRRNLGGVESELAGCRRAVERMIQPDGPE